MHMCICTYVLFINDDIVFYHGNKIYFFGYLHYFETFSYREMFLKCIRIHYTLRRLVYTISYYLRVFHLHLDYINVIS